jgi:hypothetical protein
MIISIKFHDVSLQVAVNRGYENKNISGLISTVSEEALDLKLCSAKSL